MSVPIENPILMSGVGIHSVMATKPGDRDPRWAVLLEVWGEGLRDHQRRSEQVMLRPDDARQFAEALLAVITELGNPEWEAEHRRTQPDWTE